MKLKTNNLNLKNRAKSFYFASLFFDRKIQKDVNDLYRFCRYIDDLADNSTLNKKKIKDELKYLKQCLKKKKSQNQIIDNFISIMKEYNIRASTPLYLISGIFDDLKKVNISSFNQLFFYSYKVAGTVGLMMCKIMKTNNIKQNLKGIQLGIAMQITNICRDIKEDLKRDRIYFPKTYRSFRFKNCDEILSNISLQKKLSKDMLKLMNDSDDLYANSWNVILELPFKYRIPIAIAANLYQSIGFKIRKNNFNIWNERTYLSLPEKLFITLKTLLYVMIKKKSKINRKMDNLVKSLLKELDCSIYE